MEYANQFENPLIIHISLGKIVSQVKFHQLMFEIYRK